MKKLLVVLTLSLLGQMANAQCVVNRVTDAELKKYFGVFVVRNLVTYSNGEYSGIPDIEVSGTHELDPQIIFANLKTNVETCRLESGFVTAEDESGQYRISVPVKRQKVAVFDQARLNAYNNSLEEILADTTTSCIAGRTVRQYITALYTRNCDKRRQR